jgi:hypothetical protein
MEEITKNLLTLLKADATVSAAFGNRMHINLVPDGTAYPYAVIRKVVENPDYTHDGIYGTVSVVQIDVYDESLSDCNDNADKIFTALDGKSMAIGSITRGLVFTQNITHNWTPEERRFRCTMQALISRTV